jgi:hypothetical protein
MLSIRRRQIEPYEPFLQRTWNSRSKLSMAYPNGINWRFAQNISCA